MEKCQIKLFLANDNKTLREGIRLAFKEHAPHIQIVEEANSFQDLLNKLPVTKFDILISDDIMNGENILTYLPGIREQYPDLKIILNSIFTEEVPHLEKAREWINGWVSFSLEPENFVQAVETVKNGGKYYFSKFNNAI